MNDYQLMKEALDSNLSSEAKIAIINLINAVKEIYQTCEHLVGTHEPIKQTSEPEYPIISRQNFLKLIGHKENLQNYSLRKASVFVNSNLDRLFIEHKVKVKGLINKSSIEEYFKKLKK